MSVNGSAEKVANHALVLLAARVMAVVGVPIALGFAVWLTDAVIDTSKAVVRIEGEIKTIAVQINATVGRVDRIERYVDDKR